MIEGLFVMFVGIAISLWAQFKVKRTFRKYDGFVARSGATADQVARDILRRGGLDVGVEPVQGHLTDHYDPRDRMLRLSESVYGNRSLAAIGVAAHEAGHAFQHAQGYVPLSLRTSLVPVANWGSKLSWIFIIAGGFCSAYLNFSFSASRSFPQPSSSASSPCQLNLMPATAPSTSWPLAGI